MIINRSTLAKNYLYELEDEIDFSSYQLASNIRSLSKAKVEAKAVDYGDVLRIEVAVQVDVVAICSYTLEDVPLSLNIRDELDFSSSLEDVEQYFYIDKPIFELDPYILGIILANIPDKVVKPGAKLPESGNGYRVLTEEELAKERREKTDSRWSKLDELDIGE